MNTEGPESPQSWGFVKAAAGGVGTARDSSTPDTMVTSGGGTRHLAVTHERAALWVFVAVELACVPYFVWLARATWFVADEWDFLAGRSAGSLHDLFVPHNQHWSTLPVLAYRFLWQVVGLRSYLPYLVLVVVLHLVVAALLRLVMRRAGVSPWMATLAALVFATFGTGYDDMVWGFQIGYDGALVFGLAALALADRDGSFGRRDLLAVLAGVASLMCSGVGVTMAVVVGLAMLLRRGLRPALEFAVPLAVVYLVWLALIGHQGYHGQPASAGDIARFVWHYLVGTFDAIGHIRAGGLILAIMLVVGGWIAWNGRTAPARRRELPAPVSLLVCTIVFFVIVGSGRSAPIPGFARPTQNPQYLDVGAALVLPALAVAADAIARRWRLLAPVVVVVLVMGIPGNLNILIHETRQAASTYRAYKSFILSVPRLPVARYLPASVHPDPAFDQWITIGWLRAGVASGRIPPPGPVPSGNIATWTLHLALQPVTHGPAACSPAGLPPVALPATLHLEAGDVIRLRPGATITYLPDHGAPSQPLSFSGSYRVYQRMTVSVKPAGPSGTATLCAPAPRT